jgi:hypothetical protein
MDCNSMTTPMVINMNILSDSDLDLIDPKMYIQFIESLMYLVNTKSDICFTMNTLSRYMVEPIHVHWIVSKHV